MNYRSEDAIVGCMGCVALHNIPLCLELNGNRYGHCVRNELIFIADVSGDIFIDPLADMSVLRVNRKK